MAKILDIRDQLVLVGMDDGSVVEVSKSSLNFEVKIFMILDCYEHGGKYRFSLNPRYNQNQLSTSSQTSYVEQERRPPPEDSIYVTKIPYGVLRLFFGNLGLHHFYAGNKKRGFTTLIITIVSCLLIQLGLLPNIHATGGLVALYMVVGLITLICLNLYLFITALVVLFSQSNSYGEILIKSDW